jgi:hypothetical protein
MKKNCLVALLVLLVLGPPYTAHCYDETSNEVLLVIREDKIMAFSGLKNHWVSVKRRLGEKIIVDKHKGHVAVVVTSDRILGFSALTDSWSRESLRVREEFRDLEVDDNVATVVTNHRILGFSARAGSWVEAD